MRSAPVALALLAACAVGCGSSSSEATNDAGPTGWHVAGAALRDETGRAAIFRGLNLSGDHKSKPYFSWQQLADYQRIRDEWGMNSIRFLVIWAAIEPAPGQWDAGYLDEVAKRLEWARQANLSVVLDMHQDLYGEGFGGDGAPRWTCDESEYAAYQPTTPWFLNYTNAHMTACYDHFWGSPDLLADYVEAWRRLAARVKDEPAVVGFDPMNEPYWGSQTTSEFEQGSLAELYDQVVSAVRGEAPGWVAFLEPSASRNFGIPSHLLPFTIPNVVYAPHSYDSSAESGAGFDPKAHDALVSKVVALGNEGAALGAPTWIGEYGGMTNTPGIGAYMDAEYAGAGQAVAGQEYWDYAKNDGYGMLAADGSDKPELWDAIVRPYPERVAGDPHGWSFDASSATFTFEWTPDPSITAPTEISVPARTYPNGYTVDCGGCAYETSTGALRITTPPPGPDAKLVLVPSAG